MEPIRFFCAAVILAAALPAWAAPPPAAVDEFETGAFDETAVAGQHVGDTQYVGYTHAIGPERFVSLFGEGGSTLSTSLGLSPSEDAMAVAWTAGAPRLYVIYSLAPIGGVDITDGGVYSEIQITTNAPGSVQIEIALTDGFGDFALATQAADPQGVTRFPLAGFSGSDLQWIYGIRFLFHSNSGDPASFNVSDIRLVRQLGSRLKYYGTAATQIDWCVGCPPDSLRYDVFQTFPGGILHEMNFTPELVSGIEPNAHLIAYNSEPIGPGPFPSAALFWDAEYQSASFEFRLGFHSVDPLEVSITSPPAIVSSESASFVIASPLRFDNVASGALVGNSVDLMTFDVMEGQPLEFHDIAVTPTASREAGSEFIVSFTLEATGEVDEGVAMFATRFVGDWADGSTSTSIIDEHASIVPPGLISVPSVTRGATSFRVHRPRDAGATLSIHDVTGRVVRRLVIDAGTTRVDWDGRADSGCRLAAGVYFVNLADRDQPLRTRVVLLR